MGGRGDRERELAKRERARAATEQAKADRHDNNESVHRAAADAHLDAAELHERIAMLIDSADAALTRPKWEAQKSGGESDNQTARR